MVRNRKVAGSNPASGTFLKSVGMDFGFVLSKILFLFEPLITLFTLERLFKFF